MFWDVYLFDAESESGMAASLARDVIDNALVDLNPVDNKSCDPSSVNPKEAQSELLQHYKKRKRPSVPTSLKGQHERHGSGDITSSCMSTSVHLRIAALEALETLLTLVGNYICFSFFVCVCVCFFLFFFLSYEWDLFGSLL